MNKADKYLRDTLQEIYFAGYEDKDPRAKYLDGTPAHTKFITQQVFQYNLNEGEFPIPTVRKTAIKMGIEEILTIYQSQTNTQEGFLSRKVDWWSFWMNEEGNLGKAYSYNLESHRDIDVKRTVVEIERRLLSEKDFLIKDNKIISELKPSIDNIIYFGRYIVTGESDKKDSKNRKHYNIQFVNSGYECILRKDQIGVSKGFDIYERTTYGVGYLGNYKSVNNFSESEIYTLKDKWENMFRRCYSKKYSHKKNYENIYVHQDWHSFEQFLKDIKFIPQFHLAKEEKFKGWDLDKDYYGSNGYSKDTCVFLTKKDNTVYVNNYPILVETPTGDTEIIINLHEYCILNKLSKPKQFKVRNCERINRKGFKLKPIQFNNKKYVYRYELSRNQINDLLYNLKTNPYSRRHILSLWNWANIDKKELVECAYNCMFSVREEYIDLTLTLRSSDFIVAGFINQIQYVALLMMICGHLEFETGRVHKPGNFMCVLQNVHTYDRHDWAVREVIERTPLEFSPKIELEQKKNFYQYKLEDFKITVPKIEPLTKELELAI